VSHYKPESDERMFEIMNCLDERLRHNNSAVVLAAVRVFLRVTIDSGAMHYQVGSLLPFMYPAMCVQALIVPFTGAGAGPCAPHHSDDWRFARDGLCPPQAHHGPRTEGAWRV
jgi:hypothetical protein